MTTITAAGPNAEQIQFWNEQFGPKWVAYQTILDKLVRNFGAEAMARSGLRQDERVLDVGCGCGDTSLELARRVGPGGAVVGIDIAQVMLERARTRATEAGARNVRFELADAQTYAFEPGSYDVVYSRFGVMFFADPVAAFANLASALRPGGRLHFVCWRDVRENQWMLVPLMAAAQHVSLPGPPAPGAPGPFAFADADRLGGILASAGFAGFECAAWDHPMVIGGGSLESATEFLLEMGPLGRALGEAGAEARAAVAGAVTESIAPYQTADGVAMAGAVWIVSARR